MWAPRPIFPRAPAPGWLVGLILGTMTAAMPSQALECGQQAGLCRTPEPAVTAEALQEAIGLRAACYDPGAACAGGCDAHAAIDPRDSGRVRVHAPGSGPERWQPCTVGGPCHVCLTNVPAECIRITYRAEGRDPGRILFSAPFWEGVCDAGQTLPPPFAAECERIQERAVILQARISCLQAPSTPGCDRLLPSASAVARARAALASCLRTRSESDPERACYYPDGLSAGACERGAVNVAGTGCCTGDPRHDACVEGCERYYLRRSR